jgi:hypothetical protein
VVPLLVLAVASLLSSSSPAQDAPVRTVERNSSIWFKSQTWDYFSGSKKLGYSFDIIVRRQSGYNDDNVLRHRLRESFRPWFVWQIDPLTKLSISPLSWHPDGGVLYDADCCRESVARRELRSTLELDAATFLSNRIMLSNRIRLEARNLWTEASGHRYATRLRLRPRVRVSINDRNYYDKGVVYALSYNEVAVHTGSIADVPNLFNQNRFFLGGGWRFQKYMRWDIGYINQTNARARPTLFVRNHGLMTYLQIDYLSAQYRDFANKWRDRQVRRSIDETEPVDPAIMEAPGGDPEAGPAAGPDLDDDRDSNPDRERDSEPDEGPETSDPTVDGPDRASRSDTDAAGEAADEAPAVSEPRRGLWSRVTSMFRRQQRDDGGEQPEPDTDEGSSAPEVEDSEQPPAEPASDEDGDDEGRETSGPD